MSAFETILYEKQDGVGYVTLNRPQVLNVYNMKMRDELYEVLAALRDDPDIRVGVLRGAGERAFCAGADLTEFLTAPSPLVARQVRWRRDVWGLFLGVGKPLVAALHGYVLGSGLEMALCCDIRLAAEDARFGVPEMGLGIIPAAGGSQTLPRTVLPGRAMEMFLSGRWVSAAEALRMGLVNRVVPKEALRDAAAQLALRIGRNDPVVLGRIKRAVWEGLDMALNEGLQMEARLALGHLRGPDKEAS